MSLLSDEDLELLDHYLRGELDPTMQKAVGRRIDQDRAWQEAFALRKAVRQAGRKIVHANLRAQFNHIENGHGRRKINTWWLAIAASLALLVSALLWFFPSASSEDLMAEYAKFPNIVLPIQKSGGEFSTRDRAYQAYEMNDYSQSIAYFNSMHALATADSVFLALAFLESDQNAEAGTLLIQLKKSSDVRWAQVAEWYYMWMLIKLNQTSEARKVLAHIAATEDHRYQVAASALMKKY